MRAATGPRRRRLGGQRRDPRVGATLGVAVVGSFFSSVFGSALAGGAWSAPPADPFGSPRTPCGRDGGGQRRPALPVAVQDAFIGVCTPASFLVAAVCLLGADARRGRAPRRGWHLTRRKARGPAGRPKPGAGRPQADKPLTTTAGSRRAGDKARLWSSADLNEGPLTPTEPGLVAGSLNLAWLGGRYKGAEFLDFPAGSGEIDFFFFFFFFF